jgi:hypothetical protein
VAHTTNATIPTAGPSAQSSGGFGGGPGGFGGGPGGTNGNGTPPSFGNGGGPSGALPSGSFTFGAKLSATAGSGTAATIRPSGAGRNGGQGGGPGGDQVNTALVKYLEAHQGSAQYLVATASSQSASSIIISTGKAVMALGGFSGNDQILTTSQLAQLVASGKIHYFLISGGGMGGGMGGGGGNSTLVQWVASHGTVVPVSTYDGSSTATTGGFGQATLYYVGSSAASK